MSAVDPRLRPLVMFVKHWAKFQNINDASQGTVSSYSLALMVIHYLQCKSALCHLCWFYAQQFVYVPPDENCLNMAAVLCTNVFVSIRKPSVAVSKCVSK